MKLIPLKYWQAQKIPPISFSHENLSRGVLSSSSSSTGGNAKENSHGLLLTLEAGCPVSQIQHTVIRK